MTSSLSIAIDGPVAAGKTTIGRELARRIDALFVDTGVVYRAVAYLAVKGSVCPEDAAAVQSMARTLDLELVDRDGESKVVVDGEDVTDDLRTPEIDRALPPIAANPGVREALLDVQRRMVRDRRAVVVGRDTGTVILPDADLKVYLDADVQIRATRRHLELLARGVEITFDDVLRDLEARDHQDLTRSHAPLQRAVDAVIVDASEQSVDEVLCEIQGYVRRLERGCNAGVG